MTHVRTHRIAALLLAGALIMTACGQREGVHVENTGNQLAGSGGGGGDTGAGGGDSLALGDEATGPGTGGDAGPGAGDGGSGQGPAGGTANTGGSGDGGGGDGGGGGGGGGDGGGGDGGGNEGGGNEGGQFEVTGTDRTGVTDDSITVSFHAPVTGAAPLPAESFREARDLYWKWQTQEKERTILGRSNVEVLFRDDKYDPANARQVCRELAAEAFIVAGGGGTDQIQTCGELAGSDQFPYFSAGVTERGLQPNDWYFASSMTYRQQGFLLAELLKKKYPGQKFGAIITRTENFNDAVEGFQAGVEQAGISQDFVGVERHTKGNDKSWINTLGQSMDEKGAEVLYLLTSPVDYIDFAKSNNDRGFDYVGVGVSMGLNAVLGAGCPEVDGGTFFSPFPGLDWARDNVPEFFQASEKFGTVPDDLALALWGINKQLDVIFQRYQEAFGNDLTREDFRALVENGGQFETGIFPTIQYSPDNHFGANSVHVLEANCTPNDQSGDAEYTTWAKFATGF